MNEQAKDLPVRAAHEDQLEDDRFSFGKNWARFLGRFSAERVEEAERSLSEMLQMKRLDGKRFLDVGSGSGLFSLAARNLGAEVTSFDYDPDSVACTRALRDRFYPNDKRWKVTQGSALDPSFLAQLGEFNILYSWGVLHHTGDMWKALSLMPPLVKPDGHLFLSIYNDQLKISERWTFIKKTYNRVPLLGKWLILGLCFFPLWGRAFVVDFIKFRPFRSWLTYKKQRGMSPWHDLVDWVGGYPFEVASPEEIFSFFHERGFELTRLKTCNGGKGCNEFIFRRKST